MLDDARDSGQLAPDRLWTSQEVQAFLQASRSWVYSHAADGTLPCIRIHGLLRFDPAAIRAFARGEHPTGGRLLPPGRK